MSIPGGALQKTADRYFLIKLSMVSGRALNPEVMGQHAAHLAELDRSGRLLLAGPIPELPGGLIILRVDRLADAKAIAEDDPLVRGGYQTYELGTWVMSNRDNGYQPDLNPEAWT